MALLRRRGKPSSSRTRISQQRALGGLKSRDRLLASYRGEIGEKFRERLPGFKVLDHCLHWDAGACKHGCPPEYRGITCDHLRPIRHRSPRKNKRRLALPYCINSVLKRPLMSLDAIVPRLVLFAGVSLSPILTRSRETHPAGTPSRSLKDSGHEGTQGPSGAAISR